MKLRWNKHYRLFLTRKQSYKNKFHSKRTCKPQIKRKIIRMKITIRIGRWTTTLGAGEKKKNGFCYLTCLLKLIKPETLDIIWYETSCLDRNKLKTKPKQLINGIKRQNVREKEKETYDLKTCFNTPSRMPQV